MDLEKKIAPCMIADD